MTGEVLRRRFPRSRDLRRAGRRARTTRPGSHSALTKKHRRVTGLGPISRASASPDTAWNQACSRHAEAAFEDRPPRLSGLSAGHAALLSVAPARTFAELFRSHSTASSLRIQIPPSNWIQVAREAF